MNSSSSRSLAPSEPTDPPFVRSVRICTYSPISRRNSFSTPMIQAERTPNPNSLKFTAPEDQFSSGDVVAITSMDEITRHPLGQPLFAIDGVVDVFITPEFVTVSKADDVAWPDIKNPIEEALTDYLTSQ